MTPLASGSVQHLFSKRPGSAKAEKVLLLRFSPRGLEAAKQYSPLRQVLITAASDLAALGYAPGEMHENIVVDFPRLHDLVSGSVLAIGPALVQLTFHCEPCLKVRKPGQSLKPLLHRRGFLGKFLNEGAIGIGDRICVTSRKEEFIPYEPRDRIEWFLRKQSGPVLAAELLFEVGLPSGYARALPAMLRKLPNIPANSVVFASQSAKRRA
jgi:hypothetical protein